MSEATGLKELKERLAKLENEFYEQSKVQIKDKYELRDLIKDAVDLGNDKVIAKIENLEKRVVALENQDGEKSKTILKAIVATSLSWLVLGFLNNLPLFINK